MQEQEISPIGKRITTTEHPDGRKDVHIEVNMLDVKENDQETLKAKEVIERDILPNIKASMVRVVVIHRHSTKSTSHTVPLPQVRAYATAAVNQFKVGDPTAKDEDFIVVEVHEGSLLTRVSTLTNL